MTGWLWLFHVIPFSNHTIDIVTIDDDTRTLISDESGGQVTTWRHWIIIAAIDATTCRYEDRIDIEAGWLTPLVAAFATRFYRYRQRRWQRLARLLDVADSGLSSVNATR
jgi:hypothetical protein